MHNAGVEEQAAPSACALQGKRDIQADSDGEVGSFDHAVAALMQLGEPDPLRVALKAIQDEFGVDGQEHQPIRTFVEELETALPMWLPDRAHDRQWQLLRRAWHHSDPLAMQALAANHAQHAMRQHTARAPGAVPYRMLSQQQPSGPRKPKRPRDESLPPRVPPPRPAAPQVPVTRSALRSITKDLLDTLEWQPHRVDDWYRVRCVCGDEPVEVRVGPDGSCVALHRGVFKTCNRVEAELVPAAKNWKKSFKVDDARGQRVQFGIWWAKRVQGDDEDPATWDG